MNSKAEFVACTNHSLNLAGVHAAKETVNSITFFGIVERVYTFFSSSTHRWDILQTFAPKRLKRIVQTRCSARNDAVSVLCNYFPGVLEALEKLTGAEENSETRSGAGIIMSSLSTFQFFCYLGLWGKILPEVDDVQKYLQTKGLGLDQSVVKIQSLRQFLDAGRDRLVEEAIIYATTRCEEMGITITRRVRKRKSSDGVAINNAKITFQEELRRELFQVVDQLRNEINKRFEQMDKINKKNSLT